MTENTKTKTDYVKNTYSRPSLKLISTCLISYILLYTSTAQAEDVHIKLSELADTVNTFGILLCAVLVMLMQAGFALLESGMSRSKNSVNVIIKNYGDLCFGTMIFLLIGYGLMLGDNSTGFFGTSKFFLNDVTVEEYMTLFFQTMFAATAATICSGAMAERTNFKGYLIGAAFVMGIIYPIFASWVWNENGWLNQIGFHDFAGGTTVHVVGAWCALAGILVLGPRFGKFGHNGEIYEIPGHNLTLVGLGGFILWFGWFGFNVGSAIGGETSLGLVAINTQIGATAGAVSSVFISIILGDKTRAVTLINGMLGGLVSITAGADIFTPMTALLTGLIAGIVLVMFENLLLRLKIDDVVSAVSVHGFCGIWGTLAVGLYGGNSFFDIDQILPQLFGIGASFILVFPSALLIFFILNKLGIFRVSTRDEQHGLDYSEHSEVGYPEFQQSRTHGGSH